MTMISYSTPMVSRILARRSGETSSLRAQIMMGIIFNNYWADCIDREMKSAIQNGLLDFPLVPSEYNAIVVGLVLYKFRFIVDDGKAANVFCSIYPRHPGDLQKTIEGIISPHQLLRFYLQNNIRIDVCLFTGEHTSFFRIQESNEQVTLEIRIVHADVEGDIDRFVDIKSLTQLTLAIGHFDRAEVERFVRFAAEFI